DGGVAVFKGPTRWAPLGKFLLKGGGDLRVPRGFGETVRIFDRGKQSKWVKWRRPGKRLLLPPPPPPPPLLLPPSPAPRMRELPPMARIPLRHRASLFEIIGPRDLIDQMTRPDIRLRARQIQQHLRCFPGETNGAACNGQAADGYWDSHDALTWYAWRFRPSV